MLTKHNHEQVISVKRDDTIIARVHGTWTRGYGWCYIRRHPASKYVTELSRQLALAGCTNSEIRMIIS